MFDFIFNLFKVKYINLNSLFGKLDLEKIKTITLYINLECIFNNFHRPDFEEYCATLTKNELNNLYKQTISNVINVASHYRLYFTRCKVKSNIVFFYNKPEGYKIFNNTVYQPKYRRKYFDDYTSPKYDVVNELIVNAIMLSKTISDYIDGVYILSSDRLESSVIPYLAHTDKRLKSDMNIILTKDLYDFQYVNHKFLVIYPDKDESIILHKGNLMKYLRYKYGYDEKFKIDINPLLFPFILSILGDKKRNLEKIKGLGFKKIYKSLEKLYEKEFIDDNNPITMNIEHLSELLKTNNGFFDINIKETIGTNYFSIDLDRQLNISSQIHNNEILEDINNRFDSNGLKELNDKVFSDYPIHIVELNNYTRKSENNVFTEVYNEWKQ